MLEIIIIIACILLNAALSGTEMAFVSVGKSRLRDLARQGNNEAKRVLKLRENPERTLSIIQIGITLLGAISAAVGGAGAAETLNPWLESKFGFSEDAAEILGIILVVIPITYFSVVVGELIPKSLALKHSTWIVLKSGAWLSQIDRALGPAVSFLEWSTKTFMRPFRKRELPKTIETASGSEQLLEQIDALSDKTRQYVVNLVSIERKRIQDTMVPWESVAAIPATLPSDDVEGVVMASGHTRIPVLRDGIAIGLINTKEFLALKSASEVTEWTTVIRPVLKVQTGDSLIRVLSQMQQNRSHLAIVLKGEFQVGIVTMEDIIEEIIGDIYDEDDDGKLKRLIAASPRHRLGSRGIPHS